MINTQKQNSKKITNIIVDLTNVLFMVNAISMLKNIGVLNILWYVLTKWKNPETACLQFLDTMHDISPSHYPLIAYKNYRMPDCITANLLGLITTQEVLNTIEDAINHFDAKQYFQDTQEKQVITALMQSMFNPNLITQNMRPNAALITLMRTIKNNDDYKLFLLTNASEETYYRLSTHYPDIFELFDGAIISAKVHELKPYPHIYHSLLDTYQLSPETSVFIDDQPENIDTAHMLGFNGIVYKDQYTTEKELTALNIQ